MEQNETLLKDHNNEEKGAYLGAIASIATADHKADEDEIHYLEALADTAGITTAQKTAVVKAATELSGEELSRCLEILKNSDLRFSLLTDLMNFAKSDQNYSENEQQQVQQIASQLNINEQQFSLLDQFVEKTSHSEVKPEEINKPGFLESLGLGDKFKNAGINWNSVGKGLLGIAAPLLLAKMFSRRSSGGSSLFGSSGSTFGQSTGGLSSLLSRTAATGGIGSLISTLSGGRGFANSGGLLSRVLGGLR